MNSLQTVILALVGAVVSLVFQYLPQVKDWYDAQANKGLIMLGVVALISVAYFLLGCSPLAVPLQIAVACTTAGALELLQVFFVIAMGNQGAYLFSRKGTSK